MPFLARRLLTLKFEFPEKYFMVAIWVIITILALGILIDALPEFLRYLESRNRKKYRRSDQGKKRRKSSKLP